MALIVPVMLLTACLGSGGRYNSASAPPPSFTPTNYQSTGVDAGSIMQAQTLPIETRQAMTDAQKAAFSSGTGAGAGGVKEEYSSNCSMGDRFDRKETLAYNFSDNQTRLGLKVSTSGATAFKGFKLQLTYKFDKPGHTSKKCKFSSPYQGLVGSAYNELFLRQKDTIWNDLSDRGADFWRR